MTGASSFIATSFVIESSSYCVVEESVQILHYFSYWVATEEDFVEVSVTEAVEVAAEDAAVVAGDAAVAAARRTRSGSP